MKLTVEFKSDKGDVRVASFDEATGVAIMGPHSTAFKREGSVISLAQTPDGPLQITLDKVAPTVGSETRYTTSRGDVGLARVISLA